MTNTLCNALTCGNAVYVRCNVAFTLHLGHVTGDMKRRESNETLFIYSGTPLNGHPSTADTHDIKDNSKSPNCLSIHFNASFLCLQQESSLEDYIQLSVMLEYNHYNSSLLTTVAKRGG